MPWRGDGSFVRDAGFATGPTVWQQAEQADRDIRADDADEHDQDFAEGLENCLTRDGQNSPSVNLPMNDKKHTGVADASANDEYAAWGQVLGVVGRYYAPAAVGGTADAVVLTSNPVLASYRPGLVARFRVKANNTEAVTVQIDALSAPAVRKSGGDALVADDWKTGDWVEITHDGTNWQWTGGTNAGGGLTAVSVADEAAYNALARKVPNTVYYWTA